MIYDRLYNHDADIILQSVLDKGNKSGHAPIARMIHQDGVGNG